MRNRHAFRTLMLSVAVMFAAAVLGGLPGRAQSEGLRNTLRITKIEESQAPRLDGVLDDACWQNVSQLNGFMCLNNTVASEDTVVRACFDNRKLYVAMECREPNPSGIRAKAQKQEDIWPNADDVAAVFLKPDDRAGTYFQFASTPRGTRFHQKKDRGVSTVSDFNPIWEVKTVTGADRWTVEMAIPFAVLGVAQQMGSIWRMDFCRYRAQNREFSAWCNRSGNWHHVGQFGYVNGIVLEAPAKDSSISLDRIQLNAPVYFAKNPLSLTLANSATQAVAGELVLRVTSPSGKARDIRQPVTLAAQAKTPIALEYEIPPEEGTLPLGFDIVADGRKLYSSPPAFVVAPRLFDAFVGRNFYSDEREAAVILDADNIRPEARDKLRYDIRLLRKGQTLQTKTGALSARRTRTTLAIAELAPGEYTVQIMLSDADNKALGRQTQELIKRAPVAGEVKVDRDRDCLIVEGQPFFPIGLYANDGVYQFFEQPNVDLFFKDLGGAFNTCIYIMLSEPHLGENGREKITRWLDACAKNRIKVLYDCGMGYFRFKGWPIGGTSAEAMQQRRDAEARILPVIAKHIEYYRKHPAVFGYYNYDECDSDALDGLRNIYATIRKADPSKPVWHTFCQVISHDEPFDVWAPDIYEPPLRVAAGIEVNKMLVRQQYQAARHKPMFVVPRNDYGCPAAQNRCQTYLSLIHGARGLIFFQHRPYGTNAWAETKRLAREMAALAPALLDVPVDQRITSVTPENPVELLVRQHAGKAYLICVNNRKHAQTRTRFTLQGLTPDCRVSELFEKRSLPVNGASFEDTFAPWSSHVYVVEGLKGVAECNVEIASAITDEPRRARTRKAPARESAVENLIKNSSCEIVSEGYPKFWELYWGMLLDDRLGRPTYQVDTSTSVDGCNSLKADFAAPPEYDMRTIAVPSWGVGLAANKPYTFSLYLKAAVECKVIVRCGCLFSPIPGSPEETVAVGPEWKRYTFVRTFPETPKGGVAPIAQITIHVPRPTGPVWIDALQCEEGAQATPYVEDKETRDYFAGLTDEWH